MRVEIREAAVASRVANDELIVEVDAALFARLGQLLRREEELLPLDFHAGGERGGQRLLLRHQNAGLRGERHRKKRATANGQQPTVNHQKMYPSPMLN